MICLEKRAAVTLSQPCAVMGLWDQCRHPLSKIHTLKNIQAMTEIRSFLQDTCADVTHLSIHPQYYDTMKCFHRAEVKEGLA